CRKRIFSGVNERTAGERCEQRTAGDRLELHGSPRRLGLQASELKPLHRIRAGVALQEDWIPDTCPCLGSGQSREGCGKRVGFAVRTKSVSAPGAPRCRQVWRLKPVTVVAYAQLVDVRDEALRGDQCARRPYY